VVPQLRQEPEHEQADDREHGADDDDDGCARAEHVKQAGDGDDDHEQHDQDAVRAAPG